ncbi:MAG: aldo/keto reductase [Aquificaceae bacterium]|nr:aldo/keto reductase [Aquificaceae bacterium]
MKSFLELKISELGIGTYLGEPDRKTSEGYKEVIKEGIRRGLNVVDTAIVYRYMKSERDIGQLWNELDRDRVVLSTKGGYLPYDLDSGLEFRDYLQEHLFGTGVVKPQEITPQGHCLSARFINWCLEKSLKNLNTNYVDVYFLHNPEEQLSFFDRETFRAKVRECFEYLEEEVKNGRIKYYGFATWDGFRVPITNKRYLNLSELVEIAQSVGGEGHHFRFIQLPYNLAMTEAYTLRNQYVNGEALSTIEACQKLELYVYTSASIYQGRVVGRVPVILKERLRVHSDVLASLQFVLSTPGVGTALVGMSKLEHLRENVKILEVSRLNTLEFSSLFQK